MITYALDTSIVSFILKGDEDLLARSLQETANLNRVVMPPAALYEIRRWLIFNNSGKRSDMFEKLCSKLLVENMSVNAFEIAAAEHARLKRDGYTLGDADLFIAGFCLDNDYVLVTNNTKHYSLIEGLDIEDWTAE